MTHEKKHQASGNVSKWGAPPKVGGVLLVAILIIQTNLDRVRSKARTHIHKNDHPGSSSKSVKDGRVAVWQLQKENSN